MPAPPLTAAANRGLLPAAITRAVVLRRGGELLIAGGLDASGQSVSTVLGLNPGTGIVSRLGMLTNPVHDAAGAILHGRLYVFGGGAAQTTDAVQVFPAPAGAGLVGRLPRPRSDVTSAVQANHVYLLGGYNGYTLDPDVLDTTDARHFRTVARLPVPVRYAAAVGTSGRLFIFGGTTTSGDTDVIQEVNLRTHRSRAIGRFPLPTSHAGAVVLRRHIYVLGGVVGGRASRQVWSFEPRSGRIARAGLLPRPVSDAGVAAVSDTALIVGGEVAGVPVVSVTRVRPVLPAHATGRLLH